MIWASKYNEEDLIKKAINGNDNAFETIMNHYMEDIYQYILYKIRQQDDAKDIIQEVMLGAYQNIHQFRQGASVKTWLISITKRKVADYYREKYAKKNVKTIPIGENEEMIKEEKVSPLSQMSILEIINDLPKDDKELVHLVFLQQLSYKEIGEIMNLPIGTIKSRMHNIKSKLKVLLEDDWRTLYE